MMRIVLKNQKEVYCPAPYIQCLDIRLRLERGETVQVPTRNGTMKVHGRAVAFTELEDQELTTAEAAAAMILEPYGIYICNDEVYQYSVIGMGFEKMWWKVDHWHWDVCMLPEGTWKKHKR